MTTALSVNLNKIAVLRNSRGGSEPSIELAAETVIAAGAHGITVHPRPDARHIRSDDVASLAAITRRRVEFNIEGNPFAPPRPGYPGLLALARLHRPDQITLVPDDDGQLTSDHGYQLEHDGARLAPVVQAFREIGCRVSLFVDVGADHFEIARRIGVDRVELYTGPYAEAHRQAGDTVNPVLGQYRDTAQAAARAGLAINAGHDLSQANLGDFLRAVPQVAEVSIGHALIGEALYDGLAPTVRRYLNVIAQV